MTAAFSAEVPPTAYVGINGEVGCPARRDLRQACDADEYL